MSSINPMVGQWMRQMEDPDQASAFFAWQKLQQEVLGASRPGETEMCAELAKILAEALVARKENARGKDKRPRPLLSSRTRNYLARLLGYIPTDAVVPQLREVLGDLDIREMARFALESNPSPSATRALIGALDSAGPVFRVGVVNSLAKRKGAEVVAALKEAAGDPQLEVRIAAIEGLAEFPAPSHDAVIQKSTQSESPEERRRAHIARTRLAETLRATGNKAAAERVCKAILASDAAEPQKKAARVGG